MQVGGGWVGPWASQRVESLFHHCKGGLQAQGQHGGDRANVLKRVVMIVKIDNGYEGAFGLGTVL